MKPPLRLERLRLSHGVDAFASGDTTIDRYLREQALIEQGQGLASVHVAVARDGTVAGFFTLSPMSVRPTEQLWRTLGVSPPDYALIGGYLLGRMGVALGWQRRGLGAALVVEAERIVRGLRRQAGGCFLAVDPKSEVLADWYARFGFAPLDVTKHRRRMVRSIL